MDKFTRKIQKVGTHSYAVVLPKGVVKKLKWRERQKLTIVFNSKKETILIKDWNPKDKN